MEDEQVRCTVDYYLVARTMPDYCARCRNRMAQYLPVLVQRGRVGFVATYRCPENHFWTCHFGADCLANLPADLSGPPQFQA
jgi:hypothetical protein